MFGILDKSPRVVVNRDRKVRKVLLVKQLGQVTHMLSKTTLAVSRTILHAQADTHTYMSMITIIQHSLFTQTCKHKHT